MQKRLTAAEKEFFSLVRRAGLANPFSDERMDLDRKIAGFAPSQDNGERLNRAISEVNRAIESLEKDEKSNINNFSGPDRPLVEAVFLFEFFYRYRSDFDHHIQAQIQAGDTPIKVPFAEPALALFHKRGFSEEEALRYFALGYQLRRAFFFIYRNLVGRSQAMTQLRLDLWTNVFTHNLDLYNRYLWSRMEDFSTLILGGTGSGKGTAAMAIGRSGFIPFDPQTGCFVESFTHSFVSLNLSRFPKTLLESELFGHKKGAFTGAIEDYQGVFDRCSPHGAILLDEIGEISAPIQIKLLQVLQDRVFSPVGSHHTHRFHGRVIAATNRTMDDIREKGRFRDDFFYRLCSDIITVPSLHQRIQEDPNELDDLIELIVTRLIGSPSPEIAGLVKEIIERRLGRDYQWPGNVRELEQCVRRVLLKRDYMGDRLPNGPELADRLTGSIVRGEINAQDLLAGYCTLLYRRHGTFEAVARKTGLDRRTVKKYIVEWENGKE